MRLPLTVICDFDGTVTTLDVGHALCERFAPGVLADVDKRWLAGEISFAEAYRLACLRLLATHEELVAHALEVGLVREGFADLVATCGRLGVELFVASAGLDLYVEPILQRCLGTTAPHLEVRVNRGRVTASGVEVAFPHADASCDSCGNCKGALARQARARGRTVLGIGDSVTDWCLAGEADHLFARAWLS